MALAFVQCLQVRQRFNSSYSTENRYIIAVFSGISSLPAILLNAYRLASVRPDLIPPRAAV